MCTEKDFSVGFMISIVEILLENYEEKTVFYKNEISSVKPVITYRI